MKKSKQCPKCESQRIGYLESQTDQALYQTHLEALKRGAGHRLERGWILENPVMEGTLEAYVCTDCGYLESYIAGKNKRKEIAEGWRNIHATETAEEPESE